MTSDMLMLMLMCTKSNMHSMNGILYVWFI